jgi:5-methyltetrahydrofolate--homocysteine methyltransferase
MDILNTLSRRLQDGDDAGVLELTRLALDQNVSPNEILGGGLLAGMAVVGERFRDHLIFLPDVLLAARAMRAGMTLLEPLLAGTNGSRAGTVVLGTVSGDLHDIGKNLVSVLLQGAGFEVVDLGTDVPPEQFVDAALERNAQVIGMSALLTTTMAGMKDVVEIVKSRDLKGRVATIVGGAPVTAEFAREIGADAYGFDAASAVDRIRALLSPEKS